MTQPRHPAQAFGVGTSHRSSREVSGSVGGVRATKTAREGSVFYRFLAATPRDGGATRATVPAPGSAYQSDPSGPPAMNSGWAA